MQTAGSGRGAAEERAGFFGQAKDTSRESESVRRMGGRLKALISISHHARSQAELFRAFSAEVACGLSADLTQLLEYVPDRGNLVLRAGHGFQGGFNEGDGRATVPAGLLSQAGRAMLDPEGLPVALEDFSSPHDWADDALLRGRGARSGIAVKVGKVGGEPGGFGAIGAFYAAPRHFTSEEKDFLALAAALLGSGIERLGQRELAVAWRARSCSAPARLFSKFPPRGANSSPPLCWRW